MLRTSDKGTLKESLRTSDLGRSTSQEAVRHALVDVVGTEDVLAFVDALIARHNWSRAARVQIRNAVSQIRGRQANTNLHLGVVGEFSSGKTTLINALLRDDLLKADVLQATTSAATWIRHGSVLDVEVEARDAERWSYRADGMTLWQRFSASFRQPSHGKEKDRVRAFIHEVTAEESVASQLRSITIRHPAQALKRGLVIIDTPGANAQNARHVKVAAATLRENCDAAIVVIPADIPVSQSLVTFLREHVAEILHRCIFVITKLDTVRRVRERERLVSAVAARLASELGLPNVRLYAIAPRVIVDELTGEEHAVARTEVQSLVDAFTDFERRAWSTLEASKAVVLLERVALLLERLLGWLPDELERYEARYAKRHAALEAARIPNLEHFVSERQRTYRRGLDGVLEDLPAETCNTVDESRGEVLGEICRKIFAADDKAALTRLVAEWVPRFVEEQHNQLQVELDALHESVHAAANAQLLAFEAEFREVYRALQRLGETFSAEPHDASAVDLRASGSQSVKELLEHASARLQMSEGTDMLVRGGSAGAGAFVGTLVFPVIGTVIGAALGNFVGSLFGPSLQSLQEEAWRDVNQAVTTAYDEIRSSARRAIDAKIRDERRRLERAIGQSYEEYGALVEAIIVRDQAEQQVLKRRREAIARDTEEIRRRSARLSEVRERLRNMGHGDEHADCLQGLNNAT